MANLVELDALEILAIIDHELDPISQSQNPAVVQAIGLATICMSGPRRSNPDRLELRMDNICCSAHGLSLMITGIKGLQRHTILFDTGPEESAWERNALRLKADIGRIEVIQLSHWHRDHSGGMLKVIQMINDARQKHSEHSALPSLQVDLHPRRPDLRGFKPPEAPYVSLEPDPTFAEVEQAGATVVKNDKPHTVLDDFILVSGEIPRVTTYEKGLRFGVRCDATKREWEEDTLIADERFLMCRLKGKGLVMFTGCSHAGVVNASRNAVELGQGIPYYAVMGGFHLADAEDQQIQDTAQDLKALDTKILLPGHGTVWRAKYELHRVFPGGSLVPSFVSSRLTL